LPLHRHQTRLTRILNKLQPPQFPRLERLTNAKNLFRRRHWRNRRHGSPNLQDLPLPPPRSRNLQNLPLPVPRSRNLQEHPLPARLSRRPVSRPNDQSSRLVAAAKKGRKEPRTPAPPQRVTKRSVPGQDGFKSCAMRGGWVIANGLSQQGRLSDLCLFNRLHCYRSPRLEIKPHAVC
jgi:hypothetical protein